MNRSVTAGCIPKVLHSICRNRNPDIPRAGRVGAAHGGAAGRTGPGGRRRIGSPRKTTVPRTLQGIEHTWPEHLFRSMKKRNPTVGFHHFNLRIFNLRISNPNKLRNCGCFFDTKSDFNVPGSRPKKIL